MKPMLAVVSGPLESTHFAIEVSEFTIGRHGHNLLRIKDVSVSRFHCLIRRVGELYHLIDQQSRRGTFLNGVPIQQHDLRHGDLIEVGDVKLAFLTQAEREQSPKPLTDSHMERVTTVWQSLDEMALLGVAGDPGSKSDTEKALLSLLQISKAIGENRDLKSLAGFLLDRLLEAVPADRAALLLQENGEGRAEAFFAGAAGAAVAFTLSSQLEEKVCRERIGILCNEEIHPDGRPPRQGEEQDEIKALICVPLFGPNRCLGILYLDQLQRATLDEDHLQLVTAVATMAAAPLENACYLRLLELENRRLRGAEFRHEMIGESPAMAKVYGLIQRVAGTDVTVLIRGESGTGKELAARALHSNSPRSGKPFVAINCAVLSETLLNSELFGHERGAFTGAVGRKIGKLELAHGGTLFLDEVGELPLPIQAKLLRVLQEREFERLGGNQTIRVDLRIVTATNRDLEGAIREGHFREDLFYRLNVISFTMPPLRERQEDILLLANYFAVKHAKALKRPPFGISSWARSYLRKYTWPGNVRELSNAIERGVVLGEDQLVRAEDLPEHIRERPGSLPNASPANYHDALNRRKRELILAAVTQSGGQITKAAALLDLHPNYLHRLIRNLDLRSKLQEPP